MNKFVHAFTIIEMLVVMILGAIVSSLLYQAVITVSSLYQSFEKRQQVVQETVFWYTVIYEAMSNAKRIGLNHDTVTMFMSGSKTQFVLTSTALFWRHAGVQDSLQLTEGKWMIGPCDSTMATDCVGISFIHHEQEIRWKFARRKSTQDVLKKIMKP